jgi:GcrA cell cycle regulator
MTGARGKWKERKPPFVWDAAADEKLKALWPDPKNTVNKIGAVFGVSKAAVCGRARRLRLEPKGSDKLNRLSMAQCADILAAKQGKDPLPLTPAQSQEFVDVVFSTAEPCPALQEAADRYVEQSAASRVSLMEAISKVLLRPVKACQFPINRSRPYLFCEAMARDGFPYCQHHCEIAYMSFVARNGDGKQERVSA